jgi:OmpA-OmpF porin, OOP family
VVRLPLFPQEQSVHAITSTQFPDYQADVLKNGGMADTLTITGLYRKDETNTSSFGNLGIARAEATKALFLDKLPTSRIRTVGKLVDDGMATADMKRSCEFDWIKAKLDMKETTIIEAGNSFSILFPYNSPMRDQDEKVETYIKDFCAKHKSDNATMTITGHTDNKGQDVYNQALGLKRADAIKAMLVAQGIAATRISTGSKGKDQPVADNETEVGRHQNRRVVIETKQ